MKAESHFKKNSILLNEDVFHTENDAEPRFYEDPLWNQLTVLGRKPWMKQPAAVNDAIFNKLLWVNPTLQWCSVCEDVFDVNLLDNWSNMRFRKKEPFLSHSSAKKKTLGSFQKQPLNNCMKHISSSNETTQLKTFKKYFQHLPAWNFQCWIILQPYYFRKFLGYSIISLAESITTLSQPPPTATQPWIKLFLNPNRTRIIYTRTWFYLQQRTQNVTVIWEVWRLMKANAEAT